METNGGIFLLRTETVNQTEVKSYTTDNTLSELISFCHRLFLSGTINNFQNKTQALGSVTQSSQQNPPTWNSINHLSFYN